MEKYFGVRRRILRFMVYGILRFATNKTKEDKHSKKVKRNNEKIHNNNMINSTETRIYLFRTFRWRLVNIRKIFPEVINVCYGKRRTVFIDFGLDCVTGNFKTGHFA